ncbi:MAG: RNA methyltransferase [Clostridia bacterium]|nr:RNA methyltransferase [Clostridia bacterium]
MFFVWYNKGMEIITSKTNEKIVNAKKLLDKKFRDKTSRFLVETKKVIAEGVRAGLKIESLFVLHGNDNIFSSIDCPVYTVSNQVFKEISSTVSTDGFIAVFNKKVLEKSVPNGNFLVLDNLQNPDNFGAILRTALATNFKDIYVINSVDEYNSKTIRASMGNQFFLNIMHINYEDIEILFKNKQLFAADMMGENIFKQKNLNENFGFVIGNEGNGISNELKKYVKNFVSIPMENGVESLNASISASVIMYYVFSNLK